MVPDALMLLMPVRQAAPLPAGEERG